jgi:hypothetical protein
MQLLSWSSESVRMECANCGAHTLMELENYLACAYGRYPVWCSTCGVLREVRDDGRFSPTARREPAPEAQLSVAE